MERIIKMVMAEAAKSNVDKRKVGCVILGKSGEIFGVGHNYECKETSRNVHAEMEALREVSSTTLEMVKEGSLNPTVYVSHAPCKDCAMKLLEKGFKNIVVVEEFRKFDTDKIRYDLVPPKAIKQLAEVLTFGAKKYKPNNWRNNTDLSRYEGALLRHFEAYRMGEILDEETGMPHLAHALTNLVFLLELTDEQE